MPTRSSIPTAALVVLATVLVGCGGTVADPSPSPSPPPSAAPSPSAGPSAVDLPIEVAAEQPPIPATCGTGQAGAIGAREEVATILTLDDVEMELTTAAFGLRDGSYVADDAIPAGVGLEADERVVGVAPGGLLRIAGGMTLIDATIRAADWAGVDFASGLASIGGPSADLESVSQADGTIVVAAPTVPGEYVLEGVVDWLTPCLEGDGTVYGRIVVG